MNRPAPATARGASGSIAALVLDGPSLTGRTGGPASAETSASPVGSLTEHIIDEHACLVRPLVAAHRELPGKAGTT